MNSAASSTPNASSTRPPVCSVLDKDLRLLSHLSPADGPAQWGSPPGSLPSAGAAGHPPGGKQGPRRGFLRGGAAPPSTGVGPSSRVKTARWNTGEHRSRKPSSSISSRERRPPGRTADAPPPRRRRPGRPLTPWGSIVATLRVSPVSSSSSVSRPPARSQWVRNPPGPPAAPPDSGRWRWTFRSGAGRSKKNVHHTASPLYWGKTKRRILKKDTATQGGPCAEGRRGLSFLFKHGRHRRFPRHPAAPAGAIGPPALGHPCRRTDSEQYTFVPID